ncbi:hypothetical protein VNO80_28327 [Phaseolus coccineus]|uniref:ZF-HD dimerization-type domain-containing protein n=1 Tax=Phaseolus coccineus TaxID=3886 RepID=A0AAN9L8V0_PHACN
MSSINTTAYTTQLQASHQEEEVAYEECCRNHAVAVGGASYDGCNEYLKASGNQNSQDSFLCACCGCHRNFHRKRSTSNPDHQTEAVDDHALDIVPVSETFHPEPTNNPEPLQLVRPLRRRRTIFSRDQKNQMTRFAEILGWKPHKGNREEIQRFCTDMGISRKIFVVWLNNNRHRATRNVGERSDPSTS